MVRDFPHMKSSSFFPRKIRGTANTHTHTRRVGSYICRSSRLNDASKPYHTGATCSCKTAMELPWPHCDDPTPRPGRSQMCEFQPTKGSFSFKVGSTIGLRCASKKINQVLWPRSSGEFCRSGGVLI